MKCPSCGAVRCDKCKEPLTEPVYRLPVPFGNLDSRIDTEVCKNCWDAYIRLGFEWLGRIVPPEYRGS